MPRIITLAAALIGLLAAGTAAAQSGRPAVLRPVAPPKPVVSLRQAAPPAIIVQGGLAADAPCGSNVAHAAAPRDAATGAASGRGAIAIGPKQDDPTPPHPADALAIGPKQDDPAPPQPADRLAIGPKQDDPSPPHPSDRLAIGPKQDDPAPPHPADALAIGPKQDDPAPSPPQAVRCMPAKQH